MLVLRAETTLTFEFNSRTKSLNRDLAETFLLKPHSIARIVEQQRGFALGISVFGLRTCVPNF